MEELDGIIAQGAARVAPAYFLLPIYGGNSVSRERVYCYELYHQMRRGWPVPCRYILNGEVDKRAHIAMQALGIGNEKPDFLVHNPGVMEDNHAIVEVKTIRSAARDIRKDFRTLKVFRQGPHYERGIYLFYGDGDRARLINRVQDAAAVVQDLNGIELWHHPAPGEPAQRIATI